MNPVAVGADTLAAVFEAALANFEQVGAQVPTSTATLRIGGAPVTIRAAGVAAATPVPDALSHHNRVAERIANTNAPLTIHVWDAASTGTPAPSRPPPGFYRSDAAGLEVAVFDDPPQLEALRADGQAVAWVDDAAASPSHTRFRPFSQLLAAWLPRTGMVFLHAAAVGDIDGVALLVGHGGSGKSTTSLVCHDRGIGFLADDFSLLRPPAPGRPAVVKSVYRSAKLRPDSAGRLRDPDATPRAADDEHYLLVRDAALTRAGPLAVVLAVRPAPGSGGPRLVPVAREERLRLLLPTALKASAGGPATMRTWMRTAAAIAASTPAYRLELEWNLDQVVDLVDDARRGLGPPG